MACYGLLVRRSQPVGHAEQVWLRFVDGHPVRAVTTAFLAWCSPKLEALGVRVWVLIWDNASWHVSKAVRAWIRSHNQRVKQQGQGGRILSCYLPVKSPWLRLNPLEPKWVQGTRAIVQPDPLLSAQEIADRPSAYFGCPHEDHRIQEQLSCSCTRSIVPTPQAPNNAEFGRGETPASISAGNEAPTHSPRNGALASGLRRR